MKHIIFVIAFTLATLLASAKPVSTQTAQQAAATFLHLSPQSLTDLPLQSMHLFAIQGGGFVLTTADHCVKPIHSSGYSLRR